jgi:hypothetical protein
MRNRWEKASTRTDFGVCQDLCRPSLTKLGGKHTMRAKGKEEEVPSRDH